MNILIIASNLVSYPYIYKEFQFTPSNVSQKTPWESKEHRCCDVTRLLSVLWVFLSIFCKMGNNRQTKQNAPKSEVEDSVVVPVVLGAASISVESVSSPRILRCRQKVTAGTPAVPLSCTDSGCVCFFVIFDKVIST